MTREQAVRWCLKRGYGFVELYDGEIVYTEKQNIRRCRIEDEPQGAFHQEIKTGRSKFI